MIPVAEKTTIILAGSFNPAILTPQWIALHALNYPPDKQFSVELLSPMNFGVAPRFSFDGISYSPSFQQITFFLGGLDVVQCAKICGVAASILGLLPHSVVTGLGFNFGFTSSGQSDDFLKLFPSSIDLVDAFPSVNSAEVVSRLWSNTISWNDAVVTLQGQLDTKDAHVDINFHHTVDTALAAKEILERRDILITYSAAAEAAANIINGKND